MWTKAFIIILLPCLYHIGYNLLGCGAPEPEIVPLEIIYEPISFSVCGEWVEGEIVYEY